MAATPTDKTEVFRGRGSAAKNFAWEISGVIRRWRKKIFYFL
jgi:hypothetical protein